MAMLIGSSMSSMCWAEAETATSPNQLKVCLADSMTGKDRKDLARWVFTGMAAHPEIANLAHIKPADMSQVDKKMADMFVRLLTVDCKAEAKLALATQKDEAFKEAFGFLGKLAINELMSDQRVKTAFHQFSQYVDEKKFEADFDAK